MAKANTQREVTKTGARILYGMLSLMVATLLVDLISNNFTYGITISVIIIFILSVLVALAKKRES